MGTPSALDNRADRRLADQSSNWLIEAPSGRTINPSPAFSQKTLLTKPV
jgi:hypothetical protein